eukprot:TRINITY_DN1491_c0_g2_i1.p1 TRINITY_DN1491_c0_g2~~TRINITY_DN1491_c0_g2_i1.p1  ORF type:complete len:449 (+),score=70.48 TRINITY_DN1491_c0_g2_i1:254-1600(+)
MALLSGEAGFFSDQATVTDAAQRCPFLRNIEKPTAFAFSPLPSPSFGSSRGPIFEDGPSFDAMFRIFHGREGIVPLAEAGSAGGRCSYVLPEVSPAVPVKYHPLAASAATISLSAFGGAGPFSFDSFMGHNKAKKLNKKQPSDNNSSDSGRSANGGQPHEAMGSEWLTTGNCPIAKSYRAVVGVLPLVANMVKLPPGMKYRCPPAIVAARAALAKTPAVKALRPQALPTKILAVGALGMAVNIPLGVWREHTAKFSPEWFLAVHASIPFVAMLRKAVIMPKYAVAFTIASAVLGQFIGSRAERIRVAHQKAALQSAVPTHTIGVGSDRLEPAFTTFAGTSDHEKATGELKLSAIGSVTRGQELSLRGNFAEDVQSHFVKQDVYQEALGSESGGLGVKPNDKYHIAGGMDVWGTELSRALIVNPSTCVQEVWSSQGAASLVSPAGSAVH